MSSQSFQKRQRERARQDRVKAKAARRDARREAGAESEPDPSADVDQTTVLARLAELHARFENKELTFEEFEAEREEMVAQIAIE